MGTSREVFAFFAFYFPAFSISAFLGNAISCPSLAVNIGWIWVNLCCGDWMDRNKRCCNKSRTVQ